MSDEPFDPEKLRANLERLMAERGLNKNRLSVASGRAPKTFKNILDRKTSNPRADTLWELARALGVTVSELLGEEAPRPVGAPQKAGGRLLRAVFDLPAALRRLAREVSEGIPEDADPSLLELRESLVDALESLAGIADRERRGRADPLE